MEVRERVIELLASELNVLKIAIRDDTDIKQDLKADSLDLIEIIMDMEEEFGLHIDGEDFSEIRTVGDLVKKIEEMRQE